jgi:hypothetical protein
MSGAAARDHRGVRGTDDTGTARGTYDRGMSIRRSRCSAALPWTTSNAPASSRVDFGGPIVWVFTFSGGVAAGCHALPQRKKMSRQTASRPDGWR